MKSIKNIKIYKRLSLLSFITQLFIRLTKMEQLISDEKLIQIMKINKKQENKELWGNGIKIDELTNESDEIFENYAKQILNNTDVSINCSKLVELEEENIENSPTTSNKNCESYSRENVLIEAI